MTASSRPGNLIALQGLRAQAASFVVITHLIERMIRYSVLPEGWEHASWIGGVGVRLFFVISGFIMVRTTENSFGKKGSPRTFLTRRFRRIAPLYFLFTALYALKVEVIDARVITWRDAVLSVSFIPYRNAVGLMQPLYELGWTLNYEMYFYLIFGLSMMLPRVAGTLTCFACVLFFYVLNFFLPESPGNFLIDLFSYYGQPIALYFLFGMGIAILSSSSGMARFRLSPSTCLIVGTVAVALSFVTIDHPVLLAICCGAAVLAAAFERPGASPGEVAGFLNFLGDSSYSVYLTHSFVLGPLFAVALKLGLTSTPQLLGVTAAAVAACLSVGAAVHLLIEKPLLGVLRSRRLLVGISQA